MFHHYNCSCVFTNSFMIWEKSVLIKFPSQIYNQKIQEPNNLRQILRCHSKSENPEFGKQSYHQLRVRWSKQRPTRAGARAFWAAETPISVFSCVLCPMCLW